MGGGRRLVEGGTINQREEKVVSKDPGKGCVKGGMIQKLAIRVFAE